MTTKIRCDICKKEIPKEFWRGNTHYIEQSNHNELKFDVCHICGEKLLGLFMNEIRKLFKIDDIVNWNVTSNLGSKLNLRYEGK